MVDDHNNIRGRDYEMIETDKEFYLAHLFKYDNELDMEDPGYTNSCNIDVIYPSSKEAIKPFLESVFEPKYLTYMREGDMCLNLKQYEKAIEFAKINAQRRFDYYLIDANKYIEDIGIKHMFKLANPKFVATWLNTHEFKDILISLSENSNSANKLHLLKLLKKIYPSNYVPILFNSILKQSQFKKTHDSLVKAYGSGKLGEFLLTRGTEQKPFGLNLNSLYNKTTEQLFSLNSLLEDTLLEQDQLNDDIYNVTKNPLTSNFNSILLNPQLLYNALKDARSLTALGDFDPFWESNIWDETGDLIIEELDQQVHDSKKLAYYVLQKNKIDHILNQHPTFFSHMEYPLNFQFSKYLFSLSNTSKNLEIQDYQIKRNDLILEGASKLENLLHSQNRWWIGIPKGYWYYPKLMLKPTNFVLGVQNRLSFLLGDSIDEKPSPKTAQEQISYFLINYYVPKFKNLVEMFKLLRFRSKIKKNDKIVKNNLIPYGKQEEVSLDELFQDDDDLEIKQEEEMASYLIEHKQKLGLCTTELINKIKKASQQRMFQLSMGVLKELNEDQKRIDDLAGRFLPWVKTNRYTVISPEKLRLYALCDINNPGIMPPWVMKQVTRLVKEHVLLKQTYYFEQKCYAIEDLLKIVTIKANRYEKYIKNLYNRIKNETPLEKFQRITENAVLPKKVYVVEDQESEPIYLDTTTVINKVIKGEIPMVESSILNKETTINLLVQNLDYIEHQWDCIEDIQRELKFWTSRKEKLDVVKLLGKGDFKTRVVFLLEDINRLLVNQSINLPHNKELRKLLIMTLLKTVEKRLIARMSRMYSEVLEHTRDL